MSRQPPLFVDRFPAGNGCRNRPLWKDGDCRLVRVGTGGSDSFRSRDRNQSRRPHVNSAIVWMPLVPGRMDRRWCTPHITAGHRATAAKECRPSRGTRDCVGLKGCRVSCDAAVAVQGARRPCWLFHRPTYAPRRTNPMSMAVSCTSPSTERITRISISPASPTRCDFPIGPALRGVSRQTLR